MKTNTPTRCSWLTADPLYIRYHDEEWGRPAYEDAKLFEMLLLESMQAGLSWITILKKRENFRAAFDGFAPELIAEYGEEKVEELLQNAGIIRSRAKILAAINNARCFLEIQQEEGSFSRWIWAFIGGKPLVSSRASGELAPAKTELSERISRVLKKRGFKFLGPTIVYAFMQASGMVNDHDASCFLCP